MELNMSALSVAELAQLWRTVKDEESRLQARRRDIGKALLAKLEQPPSGEGTTHPDIDGFKATVQYTLKREIDDDIAVDDLRQALPETLFNDLVRFKAEINVGALKAIREQFPEAYAAIANHITTKPGSPQIDLVPIDGGVRGDDQE
jgi:hypothetical protein